MLIFINVSCPLTASIEKPVCIASHFKCFHFKVIDKYLQSFLTILEKMELISK